MANSKPGQKAPASKVLHIISTAVMSISALMLVLELLNVAKTYAGGILLGIGFMLEGLAGFYMDKDAKRDPRNKPAAVVGIGLLILIAGIVYLILDLR
jgi:multidrug transporter EmrE-like cation transporter